MGFCAVKIFFRALYFRILLSFMMLCFALNAHAVVASGFFQSEQFVEDQSSQQRRYAVKKGFEEILIKLAGSREILLRPELRVALQKPSAYLQKFSYFIKSEQEKQSWIRLNYNGAQIEEIFYEMKLPLWSKDRPPLMTWFGIDDGVLGRAIVSDANPLLSEYKAILQSEAQRRGLSLRWPKLDDQDSQTLSITDLWSMDMTAITNASRRYSAQLILLAKASLSPSKTWYGQWGMEYEGRAQWFEGGAPEFKDIAEKLIDTIAQELSATYAIEVGHEISESLLLEIEGVISLKDYAEISSLLEGLLPVSHLAVKQVLPSSLQFELQVQGGVKQILPSLKLQPRLRVIPQSYSQEPSTVNHETATEDSTHSIEHQGDVEPAQTVIKYRWLGS